MSLDFPTNEVEYFSLENYQRQMLEETRLEAKSGYEFIAEYEEDCYER